MSTRLVIQQGTTWGVSWPITDAQGNPLDVSGSTVRAQIRPSKDSGEVLHEFSTEAGNAVAEQNAVTLSVQPATSSAWSWRNGVYDVELTDSTGRVARIAEGTVTISPEVTR